jgi:hypothetical protein
VEVPPDSGIYERALLLLQPVWARIGRHVVVWVAMFGILIVVHERWPGIPRRVAGLMIASTRRGAFFHRMGRSPARAAASGRQLATARLSCWRSRIEVNEDCLVCDGANVLWSEVSDAAEVVLRHGYPRSMQGRARGCRGGAQETSNRV